VTSKRYNRVIDRYGNENNLYDPRSIIRTTEKKPFNGKRETMPIEEISSVQETNSESYNEGDFFSFPNMSTIQAPALMAQKNYHV
jgi:hypothetical protein